MDMFDLYRPFRNYLKGFDMVSSLQNIAFLSQYQTMGKALPPHLRFDKSVIESIYPWDLDILAKEIVLNAEGQKKLTLGNLHEVSKCINFLREIDNEISKRTSLDDSNVFLEMHRIMHRQFPLQINPHSRYMVRYFKIYSDADLKNILDKALGITIREIVLLSFITMGHNLNNGFVIDSSQDFSVAGVTADHTRQYYKLLSVDLGTLRHRIKDSQQYNENWLYSWNPLVANPLISFLPEKPEFLMCPLPAYLHTRTFEGLFYNLASIKGFDNAYGGAFELYVGEVLNVVFKSKEFRVYEEREYQVEGSPKHGVDWIVSDNTGHIFIECKTKRMTLNGKFKVLSDALDNDLSIMAEAVVQSYKNIQDALGGLIEWKPDGKPVFPVIITLESWLMFTPPIYKILLDKIKELLGQNGILLSVLNDMPFTIVWIDEFELNAQIVSEVGIGPYLSKKTDEDHQQWLMSTFANQNFASELKEVKYCLFDDTFEDILPK